MSTGEKLREIRLKRHKTLDDVAQAINASPTTISKYESGKVANIPQKKLEAIAAYLDVSPLYIMGYDDEDYDGNIVLNIEEQLMLEEYRQLSYANQKTVNMLVHRLLEVETEPEPQTIQLTL